MRKREGEARATAQTVVAGEEGSTIFSADYFHLFRVLGFYCFGVSWFRLYLHLQCILFYLSRTLQGGGGGLYFRFRVYVYIRFRV